MIEDFIESAIIIDDVEEEITSLKTLLESKDIWVKYYEPSELKGRTSPLKNRKIIFLDLYISETSKEPEGHISEIRQIFKQVLAKNFGTYGIVVWSAHTDEIELLKLKIQNDIDQYTLPLFIVGLNKTKYIKQKNFDDLFHDLEEVLDQSTAANFFIQWNILVNYGKDRALNNIYSLIKDYEIQESNLQFILFQLALNYTGIPFNQIENYPLHIDALKAFNDMMNYEITNLPQIVSNIFKDYKKISFCGQSTDTKKYKKFVTNELFLENSPVNKNDTSHKEMVLKLENEIQMIYSQINGKLLIDDNELDQETIVPGNVYQILKSRSPYKIEKLPKNSNPILIEMTPPCDFSQGKSAYPKVLGGYITKYEKKVKNELKEYNYKEIWPLSLKNDDEIQIIVFDFRYFGVIKKEELLDAKKYKILFRAKDKLFADILQKLSSHTARLGLAVIH